MMDEQQPPIKAYRANILDDGDCEHEQPRWGFCTACRRFDAFFGHPSTYGEWGPEMLPDNAEVKGDTT
jgi:hypothetical protein